MKSLSFHAIDLVGAIPVKLSASQQVVKVSIVNRFFLVFLNLMKMPCLVYFSVELPNYSTESTEEQFTKEDENYYDESSSSDLDSEQTEDFDSYGMNSIEPYHSHGTRATSQCFIIFMSIVFYGYFQ